MSATGPDKDAKQTDSVLDPDKRTWQDPAAEAESDEEATEESTDTSASPDKRTWQ
jgi:hypothetical protein